MFFSIISLEEDQNSLGDIIYKDYAKLDINTYIDNMIITDEQIQEEANKIDYGGGSNGWMKASFITGANWMREQIWIKKYK